MTRDTQSQRAVFAGEGAAPGKQGEPVVAGSLSATFFAVGDRIEREGWDWSDIAKLVPPPSARFASFDRIARRRWRWVPIGMMAAVAAVTAAWLF
jgi:hypothetical protein